MKKIAFILAFISVSFLATAQTKDSGIFRDFQLTNPDSTNTYVAVTINIEREGDTDKNPLKAFAIFPLIYPPTWNKQQIMATMNDSVQAYVKKHYTFGTK